jgi:hypothetical protein
MPIRDILYIIALVILLALSASLFGTGHGL